MLKFQSFNFDLKLLWTWSFFHYEKIMRFKKWPQLSGAGRTRVRHHHGSHTPTSPEAVLLHSSLLGCVDIWITLYYPDKQFSSLCIIIWFESMLPHYLSPIFMRMKRIVNYLGNFELWILILELESLKMRTCHNNHAAWYSRLQNRHMAGNIST